MSRVDTAWLRMDNDVNLMMIVGVWLLRAGASRYAALCERVAGQAAEVRPLPPEGGARTRWARAGSTTTPSTSTRHVRAREAAAPARARASARRCRQRVRRARDARRSIRTRPLWQFHLIEDYEGGSALIARVHHCIADGIALISVMLSITDGGTDPPRAQEARAGRRQPRATGWPTR